jgi:hypothetical protein
LHHIVLQDAQDQQLDDADSHPSHSSPNHIVLILPFQGHVWELDPLDISGPLCLGLQGEDWSEIAQKRLEMWTTAAIYTKVHNDIHAIVHD